MPLKDGRIMFAYSRYYGTSSSDHATADLAVRYSSDKGATWRRGKSMLKVVSPSGRQYAAQEPGVVELKDGNILLWIRTNAGCQFMSRSSDRGETWSVPQPSWLRAPCSPASIKRSANGGPPRARDFRLRVAAWRGFW